MYHLIHGREREAMLRMFPAAASEHEQCSLTSPVDTRYNCIAWAVGVHDRSIWPWSHTPNIEEAIEMFVREHGFRRCPRPSTADTGWFIALYCRSNGEFTHVARRTEASGSWESKLGKFCDVHHTLEAISGEFEAPHVSIRPGIHMIELLRPVNYGSPLHFLRR